MSPSSSPITAGAPTSESRIPIILTPSRKVRALLAQFSDSDSYSDDHPTPSKKGPATPSKFGTGHGDSESEGGEDEYEGVQPRGRLAARLLGDQSMLKASEEMSNPDTNDYRDVLTSAVTQPVTRDTRSPENIESSGGEVGTGSPSRRNYPSNQDKRHRSASRQLSTTLRSPSPLFFPSPTGVQRHSPELASPRGNPQPSPSGKPNVEGRSKFLALVEKHRRERIAREAADIAKRAAGDYDVDINNSRSKRARGSSPADDSSEDSASNDDGAIKRIQKQARPTRKASRKALEEMHRETQRISRNMQLAHQTTTKKKISKESLLARFNFATSAPTTLQRHAEAQESTASSSAAVSDADDRQEQFTTPPTSPIRDVEEIMQKNQRPLVKDLTQLFISGEVTDEMHGALAINYEVPDFEEVTDGKTLSRGMQMLYDYQCYNITVQSPKTLHTVRPGKHSDVRNLSEAPAPRVQPTRANMAITALARAADSDSDGEIEIIRDPGLKRKYAAFETLPRKKAKEMPSHLALRSLAHVIGNDDKKRSMNAAELESALRRKARVQAIAERMQKIENLRAKGIVIHTAEERERDQQEVEDLVERARQEAAKIQKREKELAKKEGTYVKDNLDDEDDDSEDGDFEEEFEDSQGSNSDEDDGADEVDENKRIGTDLVDDEVEESASEDEIEGSQEDDGNEDVDFMSETKHVNNDHRGFRPMRNARVVLEDDDDNDDKDEGISSAKSDLSPPLPVPAKTPQSVPRSARKIIPGLQMSDDLPIGLSQAFAATMAESQTQDLTDTQAHDSLDLTADLPSPRFTPLAPLLRLDSVELIGDSQPSASQTQPLGVNLLSQSQKVPESPRGLGIHGTQYTPSRKQALFELTQDNGYVLSPFMGNRFAETPNLNPPHSTTETVILPQDVEESPIVHRRGRLQRGRIDVADDAEDGEIEAVTAFKIMRQAAAKAKATQEAFDKKKSNARNIVDEAAEESEDEYAGLGGASDDSGDDDENEEDRQMIDEDTQLGEGDEAKLAGLYADRERERDEKEVSKLLKDITTGALRRKRGIGDDLDISDEEDVAARRREAKRREFAKMRRELLKDEAVGKIAEDKKKEAFLRSIEDREVTDDEDEHFDQPKTESQEKSQSHDVLIANSQTDSQEVLRPQQPLDMISGSSLNRKTFISRRTDRSFARKPANLAEIRESVSFLIEEPESQAAMVDLGLSDSEDEPEAYVDLDRHLREVEADENDVEGDNEDLGDFIVDDTISQTQNLQSGVFKKPELPQERAHFTERRSKREDIVDRLSLLRQASSSASSAGSSASASTKMAFFSTKTTATLSGVPTLLRRATTSSSLGATSGRENVSATGVVTNKTERGKTGEEKEFIRKGSGGRRNAVNYQAERKTLREEMMSARTGILKTNKSKKGKGFLGGLFRGDSWE